MQAKKKGNPLRLEFSLIWDDELGGVLGITDRHVRYCRWIFNLPGR